MAITLERLRGELAGAQLFGQGDVAISSIRCDSQRATPGCLFVAVPGFRADGHDYLAQALAAGAAAAMVQADRREKWVALLSQGRVPALVVPDTRKALPLAAAALYGHPSRQMKLIGVTGTDGKTSLAHLIAHLLGCAGERVGLISTAGHLLGGRYLPNPDRFTTPEAPEVQELLSRMVEEGCGYAVLEATSHGLALHRLEACHFDIAVMTNLGLDHVDFHGSRRGYIQAKGRLFALLDEGVEKGLLKTAVLNVDDPAHGRLRRRTRARALTYGLGERAAVSAQGVEEEGWGSRFLVRTPAGAFHARIGRPGVFNVYNALAAAAVGVALGLDLGDIARGLESWPGAPGRLELVEEGQPFGVVVDFAHAPDSLRRVLQLLRARWRGRVIAVFGCIGERERERRFPMGQVAARLADYTLLTDDNPYGEDRYAILQEIAEGLRAEGRREGLDFILVPDRREAIARALAMARKDDVVLLAGKGHEDTVYMGSTSYRCDDREEARRLLREGLRDPGEPGRIEAPPGVWYNAGQERR